MLLISLIFYALCARPRWREWRIVERELLYICWQQAREVSLLGGRRKVENGRQEAWPPGRRIGLHSFLLVVGTCFLISCASPQQKAARHLEQAEHWAKEGKTNEAILEYHRTIQ